MLHTPVLFPDPLAHLAASAPTRPVHYFAPGALKARISTFKTGFRGLVTYAVKANPAAEVLTQLCTGGITTFDVASPDEIALVRRFCPKAVLHYHNPVRAPSEIQTGLNAGVVSWSVDTLDEFSKLIRAGLPQGSEIAVRFKLPVAGGAYDFGEKFGATETEATEILQMVANQGMRPSLTFHVGTQCLRARAYIDYVTAAARIAQAAGVRLHRLNIGGGFPSGRDGQTPDFASQFRSIHSAVDQAFNQAPALVCEPGRGLVADAFSYAVQVKSIRPGRVFMSDGIYGGLSEFVSMALPSFEVVGPDGLRSGERRDLVAYGPTCDSLDRLPHPLTLPVSTKEGDWLLFRSMGAYLNGVTTRFNGYGDYDTVLVGAL